MASTSMIDRILSATAKVSARRHLHRFMSTARAAASTQQRVLKDKLARNADSTFGREHGFDTIHTYADFTRRVPIQTYDAIQPYVDKVIAGDLRALFGPGERVLMFAKTSGSTDSPKLVPVTPSFVREYQRGWSAFGFKALLDHPDGFGRKLLQVASPADETRTELGVACGSISGLLAGSQSRIVRRFYAVPTETGHIRDPEARYYTIMRFAVPEDVGWMVTASPATQVHLARAAADHSERLVRDVRDGTLTPPGQLPRELHSALAAHLRPNGRAAERLSAIADRHGALLPKHFWNLAFLANWTGGTMGLHLQDFPDYFGDTPVRDIGLLATEGRVTIGIEDHTPAGLLDSEGSFFEFIEDDADNAGDVRLCHELDPGREYRVVMTTSAGFYRYDIGDRVRVRGFVGQAPLLEFLHRGAHVSSITGEKLTEWQVTHAFERSCAILGLRAPLFVLAPTWADPPYYRLHIEQRVGDAWRVAKALDAELARINIEYGSKRSSKRLGPIIVNELPSSVLARSHAMREGGCGTASEQYKHQYLYTTPGDDRALLGDEAARAENSPQPCQPNHAPGDEG